MSSEMRTFSIFGILFAAMTLISQTGMDLFATLTVITFAVQFFRSRQLRENIYVIENRKILIFIAPWFGVIALSLVFGFHPESALANTLINIKWSLVMFTLYWGLSVTGFERRVIVPMAGLLGFCSLYAIFVYVLGRDPINPSYDLAPWSGGHRTGGFLSNAMTFAHVYGIYLCLFTGIALHFFKDRSKELAWIVGAVTLTGVAVVLSFTRGVWVAMFVSCLVMAWIYRPIIAGILTASTAIAVVGLLQFWPAMNERLSVAAVGKDERSWIWTAHWKIFENHPILGAGYTENVFLIPDYYKSIGAPEGTIVSHAHNQYLQWLAGTGILGLSSYLIFIIFMISLSIRSYLRVEQGRAFEKGMCLGLIGAQICFLVGGLTESNFEHSKLKYVMSIIWALVLYYGFANVNSSQKAPRKSSAA